MNARTVYLLVLLAAIIALGGVTWRALALGARIAVAEETLDDCRRLAGRILAKRDAPQTASETGRSEEEIAQRFEEWARGAGLDARQLVRIDPLSPRRVGDSDYLVEGADIELTEVSLTELALLSAAVGRDDPRLRVSRLRLTTPRSASEPGAAEAWRVELALTYLRHSPKSRR